MRYVFNEVKMLADRDEYQEVYFLNQSGFGMKDQLYQYESTGQEKEIEFEMEGHLVQNVNTRQEDETHFLDIQDGDGVKMKKPLPILEMDYNEDLPQQHTKLYSQSQGHSDHQADIYLPMRGADLLAFHKALEPLGIPSPIPTTFEHSNSSPCHFAMYQYPLIEASRQTENHNHGAKYF